MKTRSYMGNEDGGGRTKRFAAYLAELASVLGERGDMRQ